MIVPSSCLDNGNVTGDSAEKLLAAAKQKSKELGVAMNIAIVDTGANLVAFTRWADISTSLHTLLPNYGKITKKVSFSKSFNHPAYSLQFAPT